jgi:hypothetical protein
MSDTAEIELLELAFPAAHGALVGSCAWCGRPRRREHALCRQCWGGVSWRERSEYLGLELLDRARWIVARMPGARP